jgi:hypothetical protein
VDQNYTDNQNEFLWTLLANPANDAYLYANDLQRLVNDYPQSGILQALLAHASDEKKLKQASAYFSPRLLYKLINAPSSFSGVSDEKIIIQTGISGNGHYKNEEYIHNGEVVNQNQPTDSIHENYFNEQTVREVESLESEVESRNSEVEIPESEVETHDAEPEVHEPVHEVVTDAVIEEPVENTVSEVVNTPIEEPVENKVIDENEPELLINETAKEEPEEISPVTSENEIVAERGNNSDANQHTAEVEDNLHEKPIEEETFDEIVSIENISIDPESNHIEAVGYKDETIPVEKPVDADPQAEEEQKLITDNTSATNHWASIEHKQNGRIENDQPAPSENIQDNALTENSLNGSAEHQDVSKYHDEKMPYTFMWWLDKTRKEHSGIYQPYTKPETNTRVEEEKNVTDELQQQYYENIFHITSVEELDKNTAPYARSAQFGIKHKEQHIIERFIKEEPQIKPQSSEKIDNENKAKKSSEDRDELVTETLANIYSDQMLYHKAIAAYKKLILKFPEKSRYFADKIEQLEKKTN